MWSTRLERTQQYYIGRDDNRGNTQKSKAKDKLHIENNKRCGSRLVKNLKIKRTRGNHEEIVLLETDLRGLTTKKRYTHRSTGLGCSPEIFTGHLPPYFSVTPCNNQQIQSQLYEKYCAFRALKISVSVGRQKV